jgi:CheY-like chemotaxis protein
MFTHSEIWQAIDALARRRGWTVSRLALRAGLDATSLNPSKRAGPEGQPRWPSTETIRKLLQATETGLVEFSALVAALPQPPSRGDILLVDDDDAFREACAENLRGAGYRVHSGSGPRVLDLIDSEQPLDLLCTDIVMPDGLGGVALVRRARARRPRLKILYVTGYEIPGLVTDRAVQVLRKPVDATALVGQVELLIGPRDAPAHAGAEAALR